LRDLDITLSISFDFSNPELSVCSELCGEVRVSALAPAKTMPEVAVHENGDLSRCEYDVGTAGKIPSVQAEALSLPMQRLPDDQLWPRILAVD
jgi:hypothetical protein